MANWENHLTQSAGEPMRLLLAHRVKYLNFLFKQSRNIDVAHEIFQQVAVRVLERGIQLRSTARAEAWLFRILRNSVADHYRRGATTRLRVEAGFEHATTTAQTNLCPCASEQLIQLKPEYREALSEVTIAGASVRAYADSHTISVNSTSVRLHRARKALKQRLIKVCGPCAGSGCFACVC
jgi:DNA-directed RNA polymerase specialized sigma24 family protein